MGSTILRRPVRIFHRLTLITTSVGGFLTGRGYPPSIELNSNSIFCCRESHATQSCNSIELNYFWRYGNALKAQRRTFLTGVSPASTACLWSVVPSSQGFRFAPPPACGLSYLLNRGFAFLYRLPVVCRTFGTLFICR